MSTFMVNTGILKTVEVFLRVPPLFVIDEIIRFDSKLAEDVNLGNITHISSDFFDLDSKLYKFVVLCGIRLILSALGCLLAMCMFALNSKQLTLLFLHIVSVATVLISYWGNATIIKLLIIKNPDQDKASLAHGLQNHFKFVKIKNVLEDDELAYQILANMSLQIAVSFVFIQANLGFRHSSFKKCIPLLFLITTISTVLPVSSNYLRHTPLLAAILSLISTKFPSWMFLETTFKTLKSSYVRAKFFISRFGVPALVEYQWNKLNIPALLKVYYILRTMEHFVKFFAKGMWDIDDGDMPELRLIKYMLASGCDTYIAVLGLTSVLSALSSRLGKFLKNLLQTEEDNDFGTATAIVFYTMVLQNELSSSSSKERFVKLYQTLFLLFGIVLHFIHNVTNPVLINLAVSQSSNNKRHRDALAVMGMTAGVSLGLMSFLWKTHSTSAFLIAALIFYVAVLEKVVVSLIKYSLYMYDASRSVFWEKFDDYIFYLTFFGNVSEICYHISLLFIGIYCLFFIEPNIIRSIVLSTHLYFNIWCYARADYLMYTKRRSALKKIENLPNATQCQISQYSDVCAICYQEMNAKTAKSTTCNHIFHAICLRKWLNVRDRCPLCHEIPINTT